MDLGNGWTTEKLRDEILEHIWIDETGDMGGVHCMHCLGYEQGEIDRAINTVFDAALRRAKAEVLREVKYEALGSRIKCFKFDTLYAEGNDDALNALVKWIDARAAQIDAEG